MNINHRFMNQINLNLYWTVYFIRLIREKNPLRSSFWSYGYFTPTVIFNWQTAQWKKLEVTTSSWVHLLTVFFFQLSSSICLYNHFFTSAGPHTYIITSVSLSLALSTFMCSLLAQNSLFALIDWEASHPILPFSNWRLNGLHTLPCLFLFSNFPLLILI